MWWEIPEDELWGSIKFDIDLSAKVFDLIFEEVDVLGNGLLRVTKPDLLVFVEGVLISEGGAGLFFHLSWL